jgi:phosphatidylserine/phosphatidylglycerophosphate/cardiolipin synthase-like enzyme
MRVRRALLLLEPGADASLPRAVLGRLAPEIEKLAVVVHRPASILPWAEPAQPLPLVAAAAGAELLVVGQVRGAASAIEETRQWLALPVLHAAAAIPVRTGPLHVLCVTVGAAALAAVGAFLRDHGDARMRVSLLAIAPPGPLDDLPALLEMSGVGARVELLPPTLRQITGLLDWAQEHAVDLAVVTRWLPAPLVEAAERRGLPVLVLPPAAPLTAVAGRRPLDAPDVVDDGGPLRVRLEELGALGRPRAIPDQEVAFVSRGRVVATGFAREGVVELPPGAAAGSLGIYRVAGEAGDPLAAVERSVALLRPEGRPLLLVDALLDGDELARVAQAVGDALVVAVRLRPGRAFELARGRLRDAGVAPPRVIDATAVLAEGEPTDVPDEADPVRLARVAARLRGAGFAVAAIVHRGPHEPAAHGFAALRASQLGAIPPAAPAARGVGLGGRLDATTATRVLAGNRVEVELDNREARRRLLDAIDGSRERVHVQVYLATDDALSRRIEAALTAAAARGVAVRVLVDSLHGWHGSLGAENPLLARLGRVPGIEVRTARPIAGVPSIEDLKLRDHRKLAVIDGRVGLVGGRNFAHEYYLGFDEVSVTPRTHWRAVPWLDAGARVTGPAVAAIERTFLEAWTAAAGAPFAVTEVEPAGSTPARVVVHRGLHDAFALEAYLALIDTARSHIYVVNGFPLQLELQHALVRAARRGVRVRALVGNVAPLFGEQPFEGPVTAARALATQLVHSRIDAIVEAGGEAWQLALSGVPGWDPALGVVRPHVHAKLVTADGAACAVGSANLDITAAYWESELLLVVEDAAVTAPLERQLDGLLAGSIPVRADDAEWQRLAARRAWLRRWPGMIG